MKNHRKSKKAKFLLDQFFARFNGKMPSGALIPNVSQLPYKPLSDFHRYGLAIIITLIGTVLGYLIELKISPTNLVMIYILAVMISAVYLGKGPSILASILGVLLLDFLFIPPYYTFAVEDTEYLITFAGLLLVGLVISALATAARQRAEEARAREADTLKLFALSRDLSTALNSQAIAQVVFTHLPSTYGRQFVLYLPGNNNLVAYPRLGSPESIPQSEINLANWCFKFAKPAGLGNNILPSLEPRFLPLLGAEKNLGVLSITPIDPTQPLPENMERMLDAFIYQICIALERIQLLDQARQIELLQVTEKLQNALLNSISHELRTPLVTITGTLTTLEQNGTEIDPATVNSLVSTAREEADRLNQLVSNLLDMSRLEAGTLKVKNQPTDVLDMIGSALDIMGSRLDERQIIVNVPDGIIISLDYVLIIHVITNLLDNALKYSPEFSPITISATSITNFVQIKVSDRGNGIPAQDLESIFEKFYRSRRIGNISGTGLGLAICKGIVEAHGGKIWAENLPDGGSVFVIELPL